MQQRSQLFGLIDGAANPARLAPLLEESGTEFVSLYEELPEEALGPASLFLAPIDEPDAPWLTELDQIDLHSPCLMLIWSPVGLQDLATHLRAFLFAGIGDGMTAMVRFFDPRNTGAVLDMWGEQIRNLFLAPIERLKYRGRHDQWQTVENASRELGRISRAVLIDLSQHDIDALMAHTEPDELMASLSDLGHVDETPSFAKIYGKRVIVMGGGAQVGLVAMGAIAEADRHNIRGEHISVDSTTLLFTFVISVMTAFAFGAIPVLKHGGVRLAVLGV